MSKPKRARPKIPLAERQRRALQAQPVTAPSTLTEADLAWIEQRLGLDQRIARAIERRLSGTNIGVVLRGGCG